MKITFKLFVSLYIITQCIISVSSKALHNKNINKTHRKLENFNERAFDEENVERMLLGSFSPAKVLQENGTNSQKNIRRTKRRLELPPGRILTAESPKDRELFLKSLVGLSKKERELRIKRKFIYFINT